MGNLYLIILAILNILNFSFEKEITFINESDISDVQFMALIQTENGDFCTGTLISKSHLLTAYACLKGAKTGKVYIGVKVLNPNDDSHMLPFYHVEAVGEFKNGSNTKYNMALITLDEEVLLSEEVKSKWRAAINPPSAEEVSCTIAAYRLANSQNGRRKISNRKIFTADAVVTQDVRLYTTNISMRKVIGAFGTLMCNCESKSEEIPVNIAAESICLKAELDGDMVLPCYADSGAPILCFDVFIGICVTKLKCDHNSIQNNQPPPPSSEVLRQVPEVENATAPEENPNKNVIEVPQLKIQTDSCQDDDLNVFAYLPAYAEWLDSKGVKPIQKIAREKEIKALEKLRGGASHYMIYSRFNYIIFALIYFNEYYIGF